MAAGNFLYHCIAVRFRVTGTGTFKSELSSLDDIKGRTLPDLTLSSASDKYPNQLTNLITPRMKLEFYVDEIEADFVLRQVQFYIKPVATGYAQ